MPRSTLAPDDMVGGGEDRFPALKLKVGETARVWLPPEPGTQTHQPWREWVHSIESPVIEHGVAKKEVRERQDKTTYEAFVTSFISNPVCLGDFETLKARSVDVDMCPACEVAQRLGKKDFRPKIRYASPAVRYTTKQGGVDVQLPFSAGIFIWGYPGGRAKILSDIFKGEGRDLCMYDLSLGPCLPPEHYQKYDIRALGSRTPAWKEHLDYVRELLTTEGNMPTDEQLQAACGRIIERKHMEEDLRRAEQLWAIADGVSAGPAGSLGAEFNGPADLGKGLNDLLEGAATPATPAITPATAPALGPEALLGAAQQAEAAGQVHPGTAAELAGLMPAASPAPPAGDVFPAADAPAETPGETVSFEDLLGPS